MTVSLQPRNDQNDQTEIVEFLSCPGSYGSDVDEVEHIETHISHIFLAGDDAYKLKKSVAFPYLDFSTLALRQAACVNEIHVNRRTASGIYRGIVPIIRSSSGVLRIGGKGKLVDWLVRMRRFDQAQMLDRLADKDALDWTMIEDLADTIARFHRRAKIVRSRNDATDLKAVIANNRECFYAFKDGVFAAKDIEALFRRSTELFSDCQMILDQRRHAGFVRHCHGDLHLQNIVLLNKKPIPFDALEFNQKLATIDVQYDLAFLLMDLDFRGCADFANTTLNRYIAATGDVGGLACLPLFLSVRAAVRAHVAANQASGRVNQKKADNKNQEARRYFAMAENYLDRTPPRLIAIGGLSGTGKSSLAAGVAPRIGNFPGAYIARSDAIRKRLAGVPLSETLPSSGYGAGKTEKTYEQLYREAEHALAGGHSVIADAVFAQPEQRNAIARVAKDLAVPFTGIWLDAPHDVLAARVSARRNDVSDATVSVLEQQQDYKLGRMDWVRIDNSGAPADGVARVAQTIATKRKGR